MTSMRSDKGTYLYDKVEYITYLLSYQLTYLQYLLVCVCACHLCHFCACVYVYMAFAISSERRSVLCVDPSLPL